MIFWIQSSMVSVRALRAPCANSAASAALSICVIRNKPILARNLDLKDLLFDSLATGRMIAVVPFVAKILEQSCQSKVFRPPNPWLMGLLMLFVEIHQVCTRATV